ncbi:MAG: DUF4147 domain-containing protein [Actinobacteria bacterium]|nr:DUF4147 domain-containing protein [Actinomycetota bacterium]
MRERVLRWYYAALASVDPERLVYDALPDGGTATVLAIGKAAPAMCRGAARALDAVSGICVTHREAPVPDGFELIIGDHPSMGRRSLEAGHRVFEEASRTKGRCLVLVSGGGSALCEQPLPGIDPDYVSAVNEELVRSGTPIDETNLIRGHLSTLKGGGLGAVLGSDVETLVLADVPGGEPGLVASGPTIPMSHEPDRVIELLTAHGHPVPREVAAALQRRRPDAPTTPVVVVADGMTAAQAMRLAADDDGVDCRVREEWLKGPIAGCLETILSDSSDVVVGAGEPTVAVGGDGRGGRCTHASILAATMLAGTDSVFAALATDGCDGVSGGAGAVVDGSTLTRGGDPASALARFDSATYLEGSGDLVVTGDTGTNVGDLWLVWRPQSR